MFLDFRAMKKSLLSSLKRPELGSVCRGVGEVGLLCCSSSLHTFGAGVANSIPTRYPGAVLVRPPLLKPSPEMARLRLQPVPAQTQKHFTT